MKLYEDGEKVKNPRSFFHLAAAGEGAGRAGSSSGKYPPPYTVCSMSVLWSILVILRLDSMVADQEEKKPMEGKLVCKQAVARKAGRPSTLRRIRRTKSSTEAEY